MSLIRWDPFRDVPSLREAMNRLFDESLSRSPCTWRWSPETGPPVLADMVESDDSIVISADLPGLKPEDVDISITDSTLTIKGEYKRDPNIPLNTSCIPETYTWVSYLQARAG